MSEPAVEWIESRGLHVDEQLQAARWLRELDEDYFSLFGLADAALETVLVGLINDAKSEFGTIRFVRVAGKLAAMLAVFPAAELFARRIEVLKALLAASPIAAEARRRLRTFDGAARKVPESALYLAKIYVTPSMRGTGLSGRVLRCFIEEGVERGLNLCLHVRHHNAAAIGLYRKYGFAADQDPTCHSAEYLLMSKELKR